MCISDEDIVETGYIHLLHCEDILTHISSTLSHRVPEGVEDVSKYPYIFAELLLDPKWTDEDLKKLAGMNLIRVFQEVERVSVERFRVLRFRNGGRLSVF